MPAGFACKNISVRCLGCRAAQAPFTMKGRRATVQKRLAKGAAYGLAECPPGSATPVCPSRTPQQRVYHSCFRRKKRRRRALLTTEKDDSAMAVPAIMGESMGPPKTCSRPAATGRPTRL